MRKENYIELELFGEWRAIPVYEGFYEINYVTNEVRSVERIITHNNGRKYHLKEKILKACEQDGYMYVVLNKNGVNKTYGIHHLVGLAYPEICGEWFEGAEIGHLRDNTIEERHLNYPQNLRWMTHEENMRFAHRNGRLKGKVGIKKGKHINRHINRPNLSKTVYQYTLSGELVQEWSSAHEVHRQTGWSQGNICACCRGERKSAHGYIWSYTPLVENVQ